MKLDSIEVAAATLAAAERRLAKAEQIDDEAAQKLETALCEQARRSLRKVKDWSSGAVRINVYVWQLGQIFVVACPGEPYSWLQTELRRRCSCPNACVLVLSNT
eukprot:SAG31_NODE_7821_length_1589_cov_1.191946_2_plen_103_part_01